MACVVKRRGKWVVDFRDQNNKRRWETYETRREADDALAKRIGEVKRGAYRAAVDLPTFAIVAADWLTEKRERAAGTVRGYQVQLDHHLLPRFGPIRIDLLTLRDVEQFKAAQRDKGLKRSTVNKHLEALTSILTYAMKHGYIIQNVGALAARVPAVRVAGSAHAAAVDPKEVLTAEQAGKLLQAASPGLAYTYLMSSLLTGCRSGELLALTWEH